MGRFFCFPAIVLAIFPWLCDAKTIANPTCNTFEVHLAGSTSVNGIYWEAHDELVDNVPYYYMSPKAPSTVVNYMYRYTETDNTKYWVVRDGNQISHPTLAESYYYTASSTAIPPGVVQWTIDKGKAPGMVVARYHTDLVYEPTVTTCIRNCSASNSFTETGCTSFTVSGAANDIVNGEYFLVMDGTKGDCVSYYRKPSSNATEDMYLYRDNLGISKYWLIQNAVQSMDPYRFDYFYWADESPTTPNKPPPTGWKNTGSSPTNTPPVAVVGALPPPSITSNGQATALSKCNTTITTNFSDVVHHLPPVLPNTKPNIVKQVINKQVSSAGRSTFPLALLLWMSATVIAGYML